MPKEPIDIQHVAICGLGVMGASLAMAIRQNCPQIRIYGYDRDDVLEEAVQAGIIHSSLSDWPQSCKDMDVVFLATPLDVLKNHIIELHEIVSAKTIVTDVGSTKQELYELIQSIGFSGTYIGGHPMTGAEKSGFRAANPLLYENAVYVLSGAAEQKDQILSNKLTTLLEMLKARILFLEPHIHDKILAAISHLPQLTAIALVNLVGQKNSSDTPYFDLAAGGFRDLTRIASSSIEIWQDIISSNKENIRDALSEFIALLQDELDTLDNLDAQFKTANDYRSRVPKQSKGFLHPLTDILVYVTDQVGVVAKISNALSNKKIDIRDMELLKIREKEGGVFRLSLANNQEAKQAVEILNLIGYKAFLRE